MSVPARIRSGLTGLNLSLFALVVAAGFLELLLGPVDLTVAEVLEGLTAPAENDLALIVREIRLPRVLLGLLVGAVLGLSGAAFQGLFKNPLAEPGVVGVSSCAALGAVIAIYFGLAGSVGLAGLVVPAFGMVGALVATVILFAVASRDASILTLVLVGIAINAFAGALISLALNLSPNPFAMSDILLWLLGSLANRSMADVALLAPFAIFGGFLILLSARGLEALTLGDQVAKTLGIDLKRLKLFTIFGTSLAVGASVSITGAIGFVGLIVPHMIRPFVGYSPGRLLVPSALGGAALVLFSDLVVRLMPGGQQLRLGVVTALLGAPFFLYLLMATRRMMR